MGFSSTFTINLRGNVISVSLWVELRIILFIINEMPQTYSERIWIFQSFLEPDIDYRAHANEILQL